MANRYDLEGRRAIVTGGASGLGAATVLAGIAMLIEDQVAVVRGRIRKRDDSVELQAVEVSIPDTSITPDSPSELIASRSLFEGIRSTKCPSDIAWM